MRLVVVVVCSAATGSTLQAIGTRRVAGVLARLACHVLGCWLGEALAEEGLAVLTGKAPGQVGTKGWCVFYNHETVPRHRTCCIAHHYSLCTAQLGVGHCVQFAQTSWLCIGHCRSLPPSSAAWDTAAAAHLARCIAEVAAAQSVDRQFKSPWAVEVSERLPQVWAGRGGGEGAPWKKGGTTQPA